MHLKRAERHQVKLSEQVAQIFLTCLVGNVLHEVWAGLQSSTRWEPAPRDGDLQLCALSGGSPWQSPGTRHAGFGRFPTPRKEAWKDSVLQTSSEHESCLERPLPKAPNAIACIPPNYWEGSRLKTLWGGAQVTENSQKSLFISIPLMH